MSFEDAVRELKVLAEKHPFNPLRGLPPDPSTRREMILDGYQVIFMLTLTQIMNRHFWQLSIGHPQGRVRSFPEELIQKIRSGFFPDGSDEMRSVMGNTRQFVKERT